MAAPAALTVWANFLTTHSATIWLNPPQHKHLPWTNLFALSSPEILRLPLLWFICGGRIYAASVLAGVIVRSLGGCRGLWGGGESYPSSSCLCSFFSLTLSNLIIPLLTQGNEHTELLRDIGMLEGIFHFFWLSDSQGIIQSWGSPDKIRGDNLKLSMVLLQVTDSLISLLHISFCCNHPIGVPKSCFARLYGSLWV